jgi:hypothetical protein
MCYVFVCSWRSMLVELASAGDSIYVRQAAFLSECVYVRVNISICFCFLNVGWHGVGECLRGVVCMCVSDWDC